MQYLNIMIITKNRLQNAILFPYKSMGNVISKISLEQLRLKSKRSNLRDMLINILINTKNDISDHAFHLKLEKTSFADKKKIYLAIKQIPKEKRELVLTKIGTIISDTSTVSNKIMLIKIFRTISLEKIECVARQINNFLKSNERVTDETKVNIVFSLSRPPIEKISLIEKKQDHFISDAMPLEEKMDIIRSLQFLNINYLEIILNQLSQLISSNFSTKDKLQLIDLFLVNYKKILISTDQAIRVISETMSVEDKIFIIYNLEDLFASNLDISYLEFLVTQSLRLIPETMSAEDRIFIIRNLSKLDVANLEFLGTQSLGLIPETMSAKDRISMVNNLFSLQKFPPPTTERTSSKKILMPLSQISKHKKRKKKSQKSSNLPKNTLSSNNDSFFSITTLKNLPTVLANKKLVTVLHKMRVERWFSNPHEAVRDPKYKDYNTSRVKNNQCIAYHSFPKIIDGLIETNYSLKSTSSDTTKYAIPGSIFFIEQNEEHYGIFEYTINSNGECFHRCFSISNKEFRKTMNYEINSIELKNKKTSQNYLIGKTEIKLDEKGSIILDDKRNSTIVKISHPSNFIKLPYGIKKY